jgi:hypothetical protein
MQVKRLGIQNDSLLDRKMNYGRFVHMFESRKEFLSSWDHEDGFKKMGIIVWRAKQKYQEQGGAGGGTYKSLGPPPPHTKKRGRVEKIIYKNKV